MIKPIETTYRGYRFRSRLEARWAVFFDAIGANWEYEPEGFDLGDGLYYLPDFVLHDMKVDTRTGGSGDQDVYVEVKGKMTEKDAEKIKRFAEDEHPIYVVGNIPDPETFPNTLDWLTDYYGVHYYNYELLDGDFCPAVLCVGDYDNKPGFFASIEQDYMWYADLETTEWALKQARSARFEHGEKPEIYLQPGIYEFEITGFQKKEYKGNPSKGLPACPIAQYTLTTQTPDGPASINHSLLLNSTNEGKIVIFFRALGLMKAKCYIPEWNKAVGRKVKAEIKKDKNNSNRMIVDRFIIENK